jgi:hypothetical protein
MKFFLEIFFLFMLSMLKLTLGDSTFEDTYLWINPRRSPKENHLKDIRHRLLLNLSLSSSRARTTNSTHHLQSFWGKFMTTCRHSCLPSFPYDISLTPLNGRNLKQWNRHILHLYTIQMPKKKVSKCSHRHM